MSLAEEDFKALLDGSVVRRDGAGGTVVISLQDIGYGRIMNIVATAYNEFIDRQKTPR